MPDRLTQQELDDCYSNNDPPRLPGQIEKNIDDFIVNGLMDPSWAPGFRPYHERLSLVGRALHEFVWQPEQGIAAIDTTSCVACHATPVSGHVRARCQTTSPFTTIPIRERIIATRSVFVTR